MRIFSAICISSLVLVGSIMSAKADDQSRQALAREVVKSAQVAENMRQSFPQMLNGIKPMLAQQGANQQTIDDLTKRLSDKLSNDLPRFTDLIVQVYAREFTEEELKGINTFYQSPVGKSLVLKQPIIVQYMSTVGAQWGQNIAREVLQDYFKDKVGGSVQKQ